MSTSTPSYASTSSRIPGTGHLHLSSSTSSSSSSSRPNARFTTLLASYPLKLLTPTPLPSQPANVGVVYTLAYGGGLVGGDVISLAVVVDQGCGLVMLTQGSTKVFKRRAGLRPLSRPSKGTGKEEGTPSTKQRMSISIKSNAFLLLLPDSISPFASSNYIQAQRFLLPHDGTGSVLILDWVNSGRGQRSLRTDTKGEEMAEIWSMDKYTSTNEVYLGDKLVMRDRMVLDNFTSSHSDNNDNTSDNEVLSFIARQLAPYNIYATVLIHGPHLVPLLNYLKGLSDKTRQFQLSSPPGLLWSFSEIDQDKGGILRLAAVQVEDARIWLRAVMKEGKVDQLVGDGLWPRLI